MSTRFPSQHPQRTSTTWLNNNSRVANPQYWTCPKTLWWTSIWTHILHRVYYFFLSSFHHSDRSKTLAKHSLCQDSGAFGTQGHQREEAQANPEVSLVGTVETWNSSTRTTFGKSSNRKNLTPIIPRSNKWQVCWRHFFSEWLVSGWGWWIY